MAEARIDREWSSVIELVDDDGSVEFFGFARDGGLHCAPSRSALIQQFEEALADRNEVDLFLSVSPAIVEVHAVSPGYVVVKTQQVLASSTPETWYLFGGGKAVELGYSGGWGDVSGFVEGRGYMPTRLEEVLLVDRDMTRVLIHGRGQRLEVLHLDDMRRVALGCQARPAHKLALAAEKPVAATCEKALVRVWSTETGEELARRETEEGRPSGVRFLDGDDVVTWNRQTSPWTWRD